MKTFIKRLLCKHDYSKPVDSLKYDRGKPIYNYGKECKKCRKVRWM